MKYCAKCGNQLFDEAVICPKCGSTIEEKAEVQSKIVYKPVDVPAEEVIPNKNYFQMECFYYISSLSGYFAFFTSIIGIIENNIISKYVAIILAILSMLSIIPLLYLIKKSEKNNWKYKKYYQKVTAIPYKQIKIMPIFGIVFGIVGFIIALCI